MRTAPRILGGVAALSVLLAVVVILHRQRTHRALRSELEQTRAEAGRLRLSAESIKIQRGNVVEDIHAAERAASEPSLSPLERRRRALVAKLGSIKSAVHQRPVRPLVPAGRHGDIFPELLEDPNYAKRVQEFFTLQVEVNYGPWLRTLDVPAETRTQVMKLLLEQYFVELDSEEAAVHAGLDLDKNRREVAQLRAKILQTLLAELQGVLGPAGYADFLAYHATVAIRTTIADRFAQRLSYSTEPLTAEQTDRIIAATAAPGPVGDRVRMGSATFRDVILAQAKSEFTPAQWEQLEEIVSR